MAPQLGRPREFNEDEILEKIMGVFWKYGYESTGLRHICDATGLQKGSLYKAFAHKHDMYIKALSRYETTIIDQTVLALTLSDVPPRARLKAFLSAPIEAVWNQKDQRGCFLCNAAADYAAHDGETQNRVKHGYAKLENALRVPVSEIHPDWPQAKINKTAQLLLSIYSGLRIMARGAVTRDRLEGARDMGLAVLGVP